METIISTKYYVVPDLKHQEAIALLNRIFSDPKNYNLQLDKDGIYGTDNDLSFKMYRFESKIIFEVIIDNIIFENISNQWVNSLERLEKLVEQLAREEDYLRINQARIKLKKYLRFIRYVQ
ncbi:hypothetical protein [Elizabethkingia anophelis]|uniref:Uncharacterized protein n=1 Tax=Elizabethkingia anophelis TaxID=1117645 RepID=A0AAU8VGG1_9FLAO|nr:hypothetical protein [Elizabethkingia anophelis]AQX02205.1 hypothetical protein BBD32_12390 [Elizabethkingia anophelis]OPB60938.1 hypothetical protein BAY11_17730 [Elizabethkingia anophelis]